MMHGTATALRRAGFTMAALLATLAAHAGAGGHVAATLLTPTALFGIAGVVAMGGLAFGTKQFRAWSPIRTLGTLLALQLGAHLALGVAPWALALSGPSHAGTLTLAALVWHAGAALLLGALLQYGQRLLAGLVAVLQAVFAIARPPLPRPRLTLRIPDAAARSRDRARPAAARGPPLALSPSA